ERKDVEEERRDSEERYRLLAEISPDGVLIAGVDGTIHLANESLQRMLGVTLEQMIGRNFCDFFPPKYAEQYRDYLADLPEGQIEMAFRRVDGRVVPVEVSAVRFDWKGRQFAQFIIHDLSRRQQAEEALRKSEERFAKAFRISPVGILITR